MPTAAIKFQGINRHGRHPLVRPQADLVDAILIDGTTASTIVVPASAIAAHVVASTGIWLNYLSSAAALPTTNAPTGTQAIYVFDPDYFLVSAGETLSIQGPANAKVSFEWYA